MGLGSERNIQERVLDFRPPKDFVYSLCVYFSYNSKVTDEENFHSKLASLKSLLSMWKMKDLTLYGKIQNYQNTSTSQDSIHLLGSPQSSEFRERNKQSHF